MPGRARTVILVALAVAAFAGNSLLTRGALGADAIGAGAFALIRLSAGAAALCAIAAARSTGASARLLPGRADIPGSLALLTYVVGFSFAYGSLDAGPGALILFGAVQLTVFGAAVRRGPLPPPKDWAGMLIAFAGLAVLLAPGAGTMGVPLTDVPPMGAALMALAGAAWGVYTLIGRAGGDPLGRTARGFLGAAVIAMPLVLFVPVNAPTAAGALMATLSGAVTSGGGYALWYAVLPKLSRAVSGSVQLVVPPVTALAAWPLLGEAVGASFGVLCAVILGGIALTVWPGRTTRCGLSLADKPLASQLRRADAGDRS